MPKAICYHRSSFWSG